MVFQMSGNLFTQVFVSQNPHRRKAEKFGRIVDHCGKSMTERMTMTSKDDGKT